MKRVLIIACLAILAAVPLASCSSGTSAPSSTGSSSTASAEASSSSASSPASEGGAVSISLGYSAGTGFEWQCSIEPEGVIEQTGQTTENLAEKENVSGGPLQDTFTFKASAPGEAVITFDLVRGWEGEPSETQVYAFTVDDDLNMILNPYKSDFENEPEWE